jgi:hypothetical protein
MNCINKIITLLILCIFSSGCSTFMKIHPGGEDIVPPPGPKIYQQGFIDGCESGSSGYKSSLKKMYWTWKQNPELAQNRVYYKIWKDAYAYCAVRGMMNSQHGYGNWR